MIRVIIAGSRDFYNPGIFNNIMTLYLSDIPDNKLEIISGGCRGADRMGEQYAKDWNLKCKVFPANWKKYGKSAGPIRNEKMVKYALQADHGMLIAFPIGESRGTRNIIEIANRYGLEVHVIE